MREKCVVRHSCDKSENRHADTHAIQERTGRHTWEKIKHIQAWMKVKINTDRQNSSI